MLYAVLAPLALSCFAGESTSSYGLSYVRAFLGVCVEGLLIALCCIIFNVYAETMPEDDAEITLNRSNVSSARLEFEDE